MGRERKPQSGVDEEKVQRYHWQQHTTGDERDVQPKAASDQPPVEATDKGHQGYDAHPEKQDRRAIFLTPPHRQRTDGEHAQLKQEPDQAQDDVRGWNVLHLDIRFFSYPAGRGLGITGSGLGVEFQSHPSNHGRVLDQGLRINVHEFGDVGPFGQLAVRLQRCPAKMRDLSGEIKK